MPAVAPAPVYSPAPPVTAPEVAAPTPTALDQLPPVTAQTVSETSGPALVRPEPRQLPNRSGQSEPVVKQMRVPGQETHAESSYRASRSRAKSRFLRALMPISCILLLAAAIFGVLTILKNQDKSPPLRKLGSSEPARAVTTTEVAPSPDNGNEQSTAALPVPDPIQPDILTPPPDLPEGIEPSDPAKASVPVLEQFLAAKSLSERLPLMEVHTPEAELAQSVLAGPLPANSGFVTDLIDRNPVEQVMDIYYNVDFVTADNRKDPQTILVRTRGEGEPKVVADPFLDSFGGRLAAYAKTPSDKGAVFEVIVSAFASCNDDRVPNKEKKLTLKLLAREDSKEIARAYFGRQSRICRMLEDGTYSLKYGQSKACTVLLRWNLEDRPATPYLEALDIKTLDWNP